MIKAIWMDVIGATGYLILERLISEKGLVVEWWELAFLLKLEKKEWGE